MIVYRRRATKKKTRKRRPEYVPCHIYLSPDKLKFIHTTGGDLQFLPVFLFICAKGLHTLRFYDVIYIYSVPLYHETPACVKKKFVSTQNRTLHLSYWKLYPHYKTNIHSCQATPTLRIFGRILRNGVRCAGSIGGPQTKGAPEFGS